MNNYSGLHVSLLGQENYELQQGSSLEQKVIVSVLFSVDAINCDACYVEFVDHHQFPALKLKIKTKDGIVGVAMSQPPVRPIKNTTKSIDSMLIIFQSGLHRKCENA